MLGARAVFCFSALCLLVGAPLHGQIPSDLQRAIRDRQEATAKGDTATWDRLTTGDFTVVGPDGTLATKAERLANLRRQAAGAQATIQSDETKVYGDAAVERFRSILGGSSYRVILVWVKQTNGWRVAAAQITLGAGK